MKARHAERERNRDDGEHVLVVLFLVLVIVIAVLLMLGLPEALELAARHANAGAHWLAPEEAREAGQLGDARGIEWWL
jgi:hypothetical protein